MFNLIYHQPDIDNIYFHAKNPCKAKFQLLTNKRESTGLKHCKDPKAFIEYSNDIYKSTEEYSLVKKPKILIVFDDMNGVCLVIKKSLYLKLQQLTELFIRC